MNRIEIEIHKNSFGHGGSYEISSIKGKHFGHLNRHGTSIWRYEDGTEAIEQYYMGQLHGKVIYGNEVKYYLYGKRVGREEFRRYRLIEQLSGIGEENG